jgi:hypothetical protein
MDVDGDDLEIKHIDRPVAFHSVTFTSVSLIIAPAYQFNA